MAWTFKFGVYHIEIDDTFKEAGYRTSIFTETNWNPGPSGQRPIPIYDGLEFWCISPFWYKSNYAFYATIWMWAIVEGGHHVGWCGTANCPASSTWKSAAVSTQRAPYDSKGLADNRRVNTRRVMVLGGPPNWELNVEDGNYWIASDYDSDVFLNRQYVPEYKNLGSTFSVKV